MAVERLRTCEDVRELAQELGVTRRCLYKWRVKLETVEPEEDASRPSTHTSSYRKQIHQFPILRCLVVYKCRRSSDLESNRGSLGSFYTAIVRRPLVVSDCTQKLILRIEVY